MLGCENEAATRVLEVFERTPGVVDVDWTMEAPQLELRFRVDHARAAAAGASPMQLAQTLALAASGQTATLAAEPSAREGVAIVPRLARRDRAEAAALLALPVPTASGPQPLGRFVSLDSTARAPSRFRKV